MIVHSSGCSSVDLDSACNFINKDVEITLTKEDLEKRNNDLKEKRALAVYKIIDSNDAAQDVGYGGVLAEILNSAFGALGGLAVMERTHLKAVIDAKALEMCGVIPNDDSDSYFSVRGITYKFEGTVKIFPDIVCIGYQVVDTSNNRRIYMGYSETGSVKTTRQIVRRIAREVDDSINNRIGTIELKTEPSGADVFIDDQSSGKSPVLVSMTGGIHKVKVSLSGYETSSKDLTVATSKVTSEKIILKKLTMKLFEEAFLAEQKKDWKGAIAKYDEFISKYSDTSDVNQAYYRKGHIQLLYLGDKDGSLKTFEALIQRYPESMIRAEAYFGVARVYKELGNTEKMNETVKILREKFPNEIATEEAKSYFGL